MSQDAATDLFLALTPEKVLDAVDAAGLKTNPLCYPLNSFENRVYEVELEDRTRIIAKFYRPGRWTEAQILEEHRFMQDLEEAEVPVCPVLPFEDGSTLKKQENIFYSLAERRGGRAPDELSFEVAERLGMMVGRMHAVAKSREATHRIRLDAQTYIRNNIEFLEDEDVIPGRFYTRYVDAAEAIADIADKLMAGVETHRLHGDLHLGNLLFRDGILNVLDFDDMVVGPAVQDLWLCLPGRDDWATRQRSHFIEGYNRFSELDPKTLNLIEPLRGMRMIHYTTWLARRWHDPIFPKTWPDFGTEQYWTQATEDLEQQLEIIRKETQPNYQPPKAEEEVLSNADIFWDWDD